MTFEMPLNDHASEQVDGANQSSLNINVLNFKYIPVKDDFLSEAKFNSTLPKTENSDDNLGKPHFEQSEYNDELGLGSHKMTMLAAGILLFAMIGGADTYFWLREDHETTCRRFAKSLRHQMILQSSHPSVHLPKQNQLPCGH